MTVLYKCACGRYRRHGAGVYPKDLKSSDERRMLEEALKKGEVEICSWVCPYCKVSHENKC